MSPPLITVLVFLFFLGACVGSFLNVVVYRLPLGKSLISPGSHCPRCGRALAWYDNIPILGWLKLGGKCRWCREPISKRYPLVEGAVALLFALYTAAVFMGNLGPAPVGDIAIFSDVGLPLPQPALEISRDFPILIVHLFLLGALVAASLIDIETFTIPEIIPLTVAAFSVACHGLLLNHRTPGNLFVTTGLALPACGTMLGFVASLTLLRSGVLRVSFPDGEPMMLDQAAWQAEIDAARADGRAPEVPETPPVKWTRRMINEEMAKEVAFIFFPIAGLILGSALDSRTTFGHSLSQHIAGLPILPGVLGSLLGGLVVGGLFWIVRILGSLAFGKVAMGLGDIHLMAAVGCAIGGTLASLAIFPAAFIGLGFALYALITRSTREVPFGPYLAAGVLVMMLTDGLIWNFLGGLR